MGLARGGGHAWQEDFMMKRRVMLGTVLSLALGLGLAAWSQEEKEPEVCEVGDKLDWSALVVKTLEGEALNLEGNAGRVTVLNFFSLG